MQYNVELKKAADSFQWWLIDWVKVLRPSQNSISRQRSQANLSAWYEKEQKNLTTEARIHQSEQINVLHHNQRQKLKPGLVASYIRPGNGEGLLACCKYKTGLVNTFSLPLDRSKSDDPPKKLVLLWPIVLVRTYPLHDATGHQFLDCDDRSRICNAPHSARHKSVTWPTYSDTHPLTARAHTGLSLVLYRYILLIAFGHVAAGVT